MSQVHSSAEQFILQFRNPASRLSREIVNSGNFRGYQTYSRETLKSLTTIIIIGRSLIILLSSGIHPAQISVSWASCLVSVLNTRFATLSWAFKTTYHALWIYIPQVTTPFRAESWVLMERLLPFWPHASTVLTGWQTCRWSSAMPVIHMVMHSFPPTWMSYVSNKIGDAIGAVASVNWCTCIMIIIP